MSRIAPALAIALMLAACDAPTPGNNENAATRLSAEVETDPPVQPADFAMRPCSQNEATPCVLVLAGGKRLLFGAPAGVGNVIGREELARLDGLFLFSLRPEEVEGLDEVRNLSWQAGRPENLGVIGPEGTSGLIDGLNRAYEVSDALIFVEDGAPAGGFDAAMLQTDAEVTRQIAVFDTGDLKVEAMAGPNDRVSYRVVYRDLDEVWHSLRLQPCGAPDIPALDVETTPENSAQIACTDGSFGTDWPFTRTRFLVKTGG